MKAMSFRRNSLMVVAACWMAASSSSVNAQSLKDLKKVYDTARQNVRQTAAAAKERAQPSPAATNSPDSADGALTVWVSRNYAGSDWPATLHTELAINGATVNIFTGDTWEPVQKYFQPGWNTVTLVTTPQEPADQNNGLIFRIGPVTSKADGTRVMAPVLWTFRNDGDWELRDGMFSHALGPKVKQITQTLKLYWAGLEDEVRELDAGDLVLTGGTQYDAANGEGAWSSPITATVFVNDHALNTFTLAPRQIVITPYLKKGKNEIKIVSARIDNSVGQNDLEFAVAGPATWSATRRAYTLKPIMTFNGMQGWARNAASGKLTNRAQPESEAIERVITLLLKDSDESGE